MVKNKHGRTGLAHYCQISGLGSITAGHVNNDYCQVTLSDFFFLPLGDDGKKENRAQFPVFFTTTVTPTYLSFTVLAMDFHKVIDNLHAQIFRREVFYIQHDRKLVPVRPHLK